MTWLNALIFLLLAAGHAELQVAVVNRVYALRITCGSLRRFRHIHDVMIPLFPVLLVWFLGLRGPELLRGGSWNDVPPGWWLVVGLCAAGTVSLGVGTFRRLLRQAPVLQRSNHSTVVDIAERLGQPPVGDGPYQFLTRVPGNEIFQLEVNEKTVEHPRWPPEWDGLSILHLSDFHYEGTVDVAFFREVIRLGQEQKPDVVVFTGDLLDRMSCLRWLPETLSTLHAPLGRLFILGNHDWYLQPDDIRRALKDLGWQNAAATTLGMPSTHIETVLAGVSAESSDGAPANRERHAEHAPAGARLSPLAALDSSERRLVIAGDERPWMGAAPDFGRSDERDVRLLLSHTPDNLPWAKRHRVDVMFSGHNHGGQVVLPVIGPVYSPSKYGVKYASGLFWDEPTLLHVSRGVSGRHPLRYNCRPEITKLVLKSKPL